MLSYLRSLYLAWPLLKHKSTEVVDHDMESLGVGRVGDGDKGGLGLVMQSVVFGQV